MGKQQRTVRFSGMVQGVGFRYTACRIGGRYDVTGYVKNLGDGSVECLIEGDAAEIGAFIAELAHAMSGYIREQAEQVAQYTGRYNSFGVGY